MKLLKLFKRRPPIDIEPELRQLERIAHASPLKKKQEIFMLVHSIRQVLKEVV